MSYTVAIALVVIAACCTPPQAGAVEPSAANRLRELSRHALGGEKPSAAKIPAPQVLLAAPPAVAKTVKKVKPQVKTSLPLQSKQKTGKQSRQAVAVYLPRLSDDAEINSFKLGQAPLAANNAAPAAPATPVDAAKMRAEVSYSVSERMANLEAGQAAEVFTAPVFPTESELPGQPVSCPNPPLWHDRDKAAITMTADLGLIEIVKGADGAVLSLAGPSSGLAPATRSMARYIEELALVDSVIYLKINGLLVKSGK